jgi:DNA mismatch repair protein MutS2
VDGHALDALELDAILERLADTAATAPGAALARALTPSADAAEVAARQAATTEAVALLEASLEPDLAGAADVRDAAARAARGGTLAPGDLRAVARTVAVGLAARAALDAARATAPGLADLLDAVEPGLAQLADLVDAAVDPEGGDLRDNASPLLRRLRAELRRGRERARGELERLARTTGDALQERFVTERGGRPVLAVRAAARGSVPGIVHDASSSGQTLFVEPFAIVELNNRLAEAASAEREERERILRELSAAVGAWEDGLEAAVERIAQLDLVLACAGLSRRWRGAQVEVGDEVRLLGARHPLLDPATAVPIDLDLGGVRAVVISGPNTGGKTVALKTLGLAALLHQSGLRPPAREAALPVFDEVLADIGDEQSIEMSLSTFSGHVRNLVAILGAATSRSLVLLDEVAAGTDPVEGSALAQALLARLARQARLTLVTTHYAELKEWASATPEALNAATGFDAETHAPLYRIALGRPGTSRALQIAERLGLDAAVVEDARTRVEPARLRVAELLEEAERAEADAAEALRAAEAARAEAEREARRAGAREAELAAEIERVRASAGAEREQAVAQAEADLAAARAELAELRRDIRAARRHEGERRRAAPQAEAERDRRLGAASERAARAERELRAIAEPVAVAPLQPGDPVEAPDVGIRGTIASISGEEAEVIGAGGFRVRVPLARLRPSASRPTVDRPQPAVRVVASARGDVSDELDVRGMRAEEAREAIRSFVDDASLAGLSEVRVVHGRGTGALRAAARDELARHRLVSGQVSDSRDGATLARLG